MPFPRKREGYRTIRKIGGISLFGKEKSQYIEDSKFRYTMREMKKNGSAYILALPYFLLFLIFTGIPVVISLPVGFTNFNMVQFPQWVGLSNFYTLFLQDDVFLIAIQNTLVFAIITGPVSYIACFLLAWLINEMPGSAENCIYIHFLRSDPCW